MKGIKMTDLLSKTPPWVFILFLLLITIGIKQSRNRTTTKKALLAFPCIMIVYSSIDLVVSIGITPLSVLFFVVGFVVAWISPQQRLTPEIIRCEHTQAADPAEPLKFFVKGSWVPLIIILIIFTAKYIQGAITAMSPEISNTNQFTVLFSFINGIFLGLFSARVLTYAKLGGANYPGLSR